MWPSGSNLKLGFSKGSQSASGCFPYLAFLLSIHVGFSFIKMMRPIVGMKTTVPWQMIPRT